MVFDRLGYGGGGLYHGSPPAMMNLGGGRGVYIPLPYIMYNSLVMLCEFARRLIKTDYLRMQ